MENTTDRGKGTEMRLALTGAGMGLALFAVYGVLNSSFMGGIIGLNVAGAIMGFPVESVLLSRVIVALGMLSGILVAGLISIAAGATAGWLAGKLTCLITGAMQYRKHLAHPLRH